MRSNKVIAKCSIADFKDGDIRTCNSIDGSVIAIYRQQGRYFATQDQCTHAKASLSQGWLEGYEVYCPVHEARFDIRSGEALCFPATEPLQTYAVRAIDGNIELTVMDTGVENHE